MKRTKMQKGITLIALIITIIILLILAVVTIGSIKDSNIITYAQNASTDYEKAKNDEEGIISNYESIIKENLPGGEKVTYKGDVPIPAGFKHVDGETTADGIVIENETEGSQFVWVPVDNISKMVMCKEHGTSKTIDKDTLQCPDCGENTEFAGIVNNSTSYSGTGYREPGVVTKVYNSETKAYDIDGADMDLTYLAKAGLTTDLTGDKQINEKDFEYQLQKEFNEMVASVAKYKGFYVGRYETSIKGAKPQSRASTQEETITSATADENSADTWYGLYKLNKEYTTSSVKSSMIWGSQYDAMMSWMGDAANTEILGYNTNRTCGTATGDVIRNVYDLYGNSFEWTLEANYTSSRVRRGGVYYRSYSPSSRGFYRPAYTFSYYGSRLTLYIV